MRRHLRIEKISNKRQIYEIFYYKLNDNES